MTTTTAEKIVSTAEKTEKHADKRRALGRGLESLLPSSLPVRDHRAGEALLPHIPGAEPHGAVIAEIHAQAGRAAGSESVMQIPLDHIDPNPYQTRVEFDQEALIELCESIKATGVVSPIVVRPGNEGRYVLVLGERRCRASKMAEKTTIPAIVRRVSDQQAAEMTVVENLQRQDLNCMEQAAAFAKLSQGFGMTQTQIGDRVGLSRESVANYMRLLKLPGRVMQFLMQGALGFSEARELLKLEENETIEKVATQVVEKQLSFLHLQDLVEAMVGKRDYAQPPAPVHGARWVDPNVRAAQQELQRTLGLKVRISDRKGRGKIVIEYATVDDYERVVGMLRGK
jgi:ParB family transcriptional regulator, chromosome partitioning protein